MSGKVAILTHSSFAYDPEIWRSLAASFDVPVMFVRGNRENIKGFVKDGPDHHKPGRMVGLVTKGTPGAIPLIDFEHPEDAKYAFGPDDDIQGWSQGEDMDLVTITTPGSTQLFSYTAAAIVLWDRVVKRGDH